MNILWTVNWKSKCNHRTLIFPEKSATKNAKRNSLIHQIRSCPPYSVLSELFPDASFSLAWWPQKICSGCFWSPAVWTWPTDLFTAVSDNTDRQREFFPGSFIIWDAAPAGCPYKGLLLRPHVLLAERTPGKESWVYTLYPPKRNFLWLSYWTESKPYDESHQQYGKSQPEWLHSIPAGSSSAWCKTDESHGSSISSRWPDPPQAWSYKITNAQI